MEKRPRSTPVSSPKTPSADGDHSVSSVRVLVVDDYEPFRRFICSALGKRSDLRVIGEAADGLDAVRKAEELKPDLIVLDIGLPTLNGIEAARRIRQLAPESKIVFLSQESSADVVQEALHLGALGYVVKAHAGTELLAAVEAVLQGEQFVSAGLGNLKASITYAIDASKKLIHTRCIGLVTFDDVVNHFLELERDPVCPDHLDVLLDLRETTSLPETDQLRAVCETIATIRESVGFGVCSIVAGGDALFDAMREFEVLAQNNFRAIRVFRGATEAEEWLTVERLSGR
jgi:DNA-binding NarL/FixJ family response regulator